MYTVGLPASTPFNLISAASVNATSVRTTPGMISFLALWNLNAAARYLKLYDLAAGVAPNPAVDTPVIVFGIPGNATGGGNNLCPPGGLKFDRGISFALTTGIAYTDVGAVAANELMVSLGHRS